MLGPGDAGPESKRLAPAYVGDGGSRTPRDRKAIGRLTANSE